VIDLLINESKLVKLKNGDTIEIPEGEVLKSENDDYIVILDTNAKCAHNVEYDSWDYQFLYKVESKQCKENFDDDLPFGYNDSDDYVSVMDTYVNIDDPDKSELIDWLMEEYPLLFPNEEDADEGAYLLVELLLHNVDTEYEVAYEINSDFSGDSLEYIKDYVSSNGILDTIWIDEIENILPNYNYCYDNHIYY